MTERAGLPQEDSMAHEDSESLWHDFNQAEGEALKNAYDDLRDRNMRLIYDVLGVGDDSTKYTIDTDEGPRTMGHGFPALDLLPKSKLEKNRWWSRSTDVVGEVPKEVVDMLEDIYAQTQAVVIGKNTRPGKHGGTLTFLEGNLFGQPVYFWESHDTIDIKGTRIPRFEVRVMKDEPTHEMQRVNNDEYEIALAMGIPQEEAFRMTRQQLADYQQNLIKLGADIEMHNAVAKADKRWNSKPARIGRAVRRAIRRKKS